LVDKKIAQTLLGVDRPYVTNAPTLSLELCLLKDTQWDLWAEPLVGALGQNYLVSERVILYLFKVDRKFKFHSKNSVRNNFIPLYSFK
jgi:hypothetical protein